MLHYINKIKTFYCKTVSAFIYLHCTCGASMAWLVSIGFLPTWPRLRFPFWHDGRPSCVRFSSCQSRQIQEMVRGRECTGPSPSSCSKFPFEPGRTILDPLSLLIYEISCSCLLLFVPSLGFGRLYSELLCQYHCTRAVARDQFRCKIVRTTDLSWSLSRFWPLSLLESNETWRNRLIEAFITKKVSCVDFYYHLSALSCACKSSMAGFKSMVNCSLSSSVFISSTILLKSCLFLLPLSSTSLCSGTRWICFSQ